MFHFGCKWIPVTLSLAGWRYARLRTIPHYSAQFHGYLCSLSPAASLMIGPLVSAPPCKMLKVEASCFILIARVVCHLSLCL